MARGQQQYTRLAKPMGMVNLDENEFDNFQSDYNFVKFGKKGGLFARMKECMKSVKKAKLTGSAKKSFIKGCLKNKADASKLKPLKKSQIKKAKDKKAFWKQVEDAKNKAPQQRKADPSLTTTPKADDVSVQADTKKKKIMKLLMFGGIGVVILIIAIKLIKR